MSIMKSMIAATLAVGLTAGVASAQQGQQGNQNQRTNTAGVVNVTIPVAVLAQLKDLVDIKNIDISAPITVQAPIGVAANVCGIDAAVLAQQANSGDAECTADSASQALAQIVTRQ